jgi:hypothetical protein
MQTRQPTGTGGTGRLGSRNPTRSPWPWKPQSLYQPTRSCARSSTAPVVQGRPAALRGQPERAVDACAIVADGLLEKVPYRFKPASGGEPVKALTLSVALTEAAVALAAVAPAGTGCGRAR